MIRDTGHPTETTPSSRFSRQDARRWVFRALCPRLTLASLLLSLSLAGQAQEGITPLSYDLDQDGQPETITLRHFEQEGVPLGQLVVLDAAGKVRYQGASRSSDPEWPQEKDIFLGQYDRGTLEVVGELYGDGRVYLLGSYQKSDVSPTRYRLFVWNGNAFQHVRDGRLTGAPQRPATFVWSDDPAAERWVDRFDGWDQGLFQATVTDLRTGQTEAAKLSLQDDEFVLRLP